MNILVDTAVWSLALRRKAKTGGEESAARELGGLVKEGRVVMIGPVRQELLSGLSNRKKYENLQEKLRAFDDLTLSREHFEMAAELSNDCRRHGIQGSSVDFLICAVSRQIGVPIFTLDADFERFKPYTRIKLHAIREKQS